VLLRAAECENEVNGPTQQAIDWINQVRSRANLNDLNAADFQDKNKLFEQIANVERPKEFGCEFGRGFDLIRWGFFYSTDRLAQLKSHAAFVLNSDPAVVKDAINYDELPKKDGKLVKPYKTSYDSYVDGHEFLPIYQGLLNANINLKGNSANFNSSNKSYHEQQGWPIHPVVNL